VSGGRLKIGIKIGESFYEDVVEVWVGADGFETNEQIAQGLEELARQIRREIASMRTARGVNSDEDPDLRAEGGLRGTHPTL
jgi:hypothetical protein